MSDLKPTEPECGLLDASGEVDASGSRELMIETAKSLGGPRRVKAWREIDIEARRRYIEETGLGKSVALGPRGSAPQPRTAKEPMSDLHTKALLHGYVLRPIGGTVLETVEDVVQGRDTAAKIAEYRGIAKTAASNRLRAAMRLGLLQEEPMLGKQKVFGVPAKGLAVHEPRLTREQVICALRRLEEGWPDDLVLFAGDGLLSLFEHPMRPNASDSFDSSESIEDFPRIRADGGGY